MENTALTKGASRRNQLCIQVEDLWKIFGDNIEQCYSPEMRAAKKTTTSDPKTTL